MRFKFEGMGVNKLGYEVPIWVYEVQIWVRGNANLGVWGFNLRHDVPISRYEVSILVYGGSTLGYEAPI